MDLGREPQAEGEVAGATAAAAAGIPFSLSTMGTTSIEDVAAAAPDGRRWFQLYMWKDRDRSMALVERAAYRDIFDYGGLLADLVEHWKRALPERAAVLGDQLRVAQALGDAVDEALRAVAGGHRSAIGPRWYLLAAGAFVSMIVPVAVFLGLQRYFVRGLLAGGLKG